MKGCLALMLMLFGGLSARADELKADESLILFPGVARFERAQSQWFVPVRGWVYEVEPRRILLPVFRRALGLDDEEMNAEERRIFATRARLFLVDNERGNEISVRAGEQTASVGKSGANGHFSGELRLSEAELARAQSQAGSLRQIPVTAGFTGTTSRWSSGTIHVLRAQGVSVISDIDDTIKVSEVTSREALLRNTFVRPFRAVDGMAGLYQRWMEQGGAQFHYVSASPWQLYPSLAEFLVTNGFPSGSVHLKTFRWKDETFFSLFGSPEKYKPGVIEPLLRDFPERRFVFVGDSGEKDPEIYGGIARRFPAQIERIYIRNVTKEPASHARYQAAFREVPPERWRVFDHPEELAGETVTR